MRRESFAGQQKKRKLVSRSEGAAEIFVDVIGEASEPTAKPPGIGFDRNRAHSIKPGGAFFTPKMFAS